MAGLYKHLLVLCVCLVVFQENRKSKITVEAKDDKADVVSETPGAICGKNELETLAELKSANAELRILLEDKQLSALQLRRENVELLQKILELRQTNLELKQSILSKTSHPLTGESSERLEGRIKALEERWEEWEKEKEGSRGTDTSQAHVPATPTPTSAPTSSSSAAPAPTSAPSAPSSVPPLSSEQKQEMGNGLLHAAKHGITKVMRRLLEQGADVDYRGPHDNTPLHLAVNNKHLDAVELLLKTGANVGAKNYIAWTPLHVASFFGYDEIAQRLLRAGANINAKDKDELTPLHLASERTHPSTVGLLLAAGADPLAETKHGIRPIDYAKNNEEIEKLLSQP